MSSIRWGKERENMPNGEPNIFSICVCAPETSTIKHKYTHIYSLTHTHTCTQALKHVHSMCMLAMTVVLWRVGREDSSMLYGVVFIYIIPI